MDNQRDYYNFKQLISRLCETMGKPLTDELLESWWKALRHVDFDVVASHVERFLARADEATKFPRPSQMRPKNLVPADPDQPVRNFPRDYWRSAIVDACCKTFMVGFDAMEQILIEDAQLAASLRALLDEVCDQEARDGRTVGQHRYVQRRAEEIHRTHRLPAEAF